MKKDFSYHFIDNDGTFEAAHPTASHRLYLPLVNEAGFLAAVAPDMVGTATLDQHSFLTPPLITEDLHQSRSSYNFWLSIKGHAPWSVTGRSAWQRAATDETGALTAGLLWQNTARASKKRGISASVFTYVPALNETFQVMIVEVKNTSKKPVQFTATAAIPLYGRSADNIRDHRHVTSLLNRVFIEPHGVSLKPTMSFNERGHQINGISYYVVGMNEAGHAPVGVFPTLESFVGDGGDLEKPQALIEEWKPAKVAMKDHQGQEALGGLQFRSTTLKPNQSTIFLLLLGIDKSGKTDHTDLIKKYGHQDTMCTMTSDTQAFWKTNADRIKFETGDAQFNNWMMWVKTQPTLRKLFGNSFLPDFDYGRGGRGWRDLWQDCLALLLSDPARVRQDMLNNFGGVRVDGSNATIIVRKEKGVEFIADRNNISRVWMDHGLWPLFTTQLYLHQTGDWGFLSEEAPYFDAGSSRGKIFEHMLLQTIAPFFDVGAHNNIRLLDADWNDGLDMAHDKGESVAFTAFFAGNLESLAQMLELAQHKAGWTDVKIAKEMMPLLDTLNDKVDYASVAAKLKRRDQFRAGLKKGFSGDRVSVSVDKLRADLRAKAAWIKDHLNKSEWIEHGGNGWFNGYYDNNGRRVEGPSPASATRMTLTGQVFPIMAGIANEPRTKAIVRAVNAHLLDRKLGGIRLNTDFVGPQPSLGRAFSFSYGDKENGAVFSHMVVMYANALYRRGFAEEGFQALSSLYTMAMNTEKSRIFPGLPEYFNGSGRGLYCYLTGSASWYVYTLLTQVFGVRGEAGDLLIHPQLVPAQFDRKGQASVEFFFAGSRVKVRFINAKKRAPSDWKIGLVKSGGHTVPLVRRTDREVLISRSFISKMKAGEIDVELA